MALTTAMRQSYSGMPGGAKHGLTALAAALATFAATYFSTFVPHSPAAVDNRVAVLESKVDAMKDDLREVRQDVKTLLLRR